MIEIRDICKTYHPKKGVPVTALDNVSLKFADTGMVFILGKSGSGKSTLLNVLGGLDRADSGEIIIKGKSSNHFTQSDFDSYRNTFIGFIFQEYNILPEFTVGANIALAMELQGKKATNEALSAILEEVDLVGYGNRKPNELSGGQKQRVAIARALIKEPQVIMADEPTGALDSNTGKQVFDTLKKLSKEKLVLIVSHDRDFAELYADRIIELKDGCVISDVSKNSLPAEKISEGMNVIENSVIHVQKGYRLTPADLEKINQYLAGAQSDALITFDKDKNAEVRKAIKINEQGGKDAFLDTEEKDVAQKEYTPADSRLIRSRLPFKNSFKIGASSLKSKPVRLFFTVFLCFVAFTLFGLADTVGSYNRNTALTQSIIDGNIGIAAFEKQVGDEDGYFRSVLLSGADVARIEADTGLVMAPVFAGSNIHENGISFSDSISDQRNVQSMNFSYYNCRTAGFVELTESALSELGATLAVGRMPETTEEVVIPLYIFEHFDLGGISQPGESKISADDISSPSDILGKKIGYQFGGSVKHFTIVGVMDTHFDSTSYESFKPSDTNQNDSGNMVIDYVKYNELQNKLRYSLNAMTVVKSGTLAELVSQGVKSRVQYKKGISLENSYLNLYNNSGYGRSYNGAVKLSDLSTTDNIVWIDGVRTSLAEGEVIVPYFGSNSSGDLMESTLRAQSVTYLSELYPNEDWQNISIREALYRIENLILRDLSDYTSLPTDASFTADVAESYGLEEQDITEDMKWEYYRQYLRDVNRGYYENQYGGACGYTFVFPHIKRIFEMEEIGGGIGTVGTMTMGNHNTSMYEDKEYTVVGYYFPSQDHLYRHLSDQGWMGYLLSEFASYGYELPVIVSEQTYSFLEQGGDGLYGFAIGKMPSGRAEIADLVKYNYTEQDNVKYALQNEVSYIIEQINDIVEVLSQVFLYVGLFFAVFASLMLYNFISVSINYKKREIGILRAVGARSSDVFGIFFNESMLITLINFVLASVGTTAVVSVINNVLRKEYGFVLTVLHVGIRQYLLILAVGVLVAFLASFLPVMKIARKRPIDAIQNR